MRITRENFDAFIQKYEEDELLYRDIYLHEKESPDTFAEYVKTLDTAFIRKHQMYVPALRDEPWFPYMDEPLFFQNIPGNIVISKHLRYTPEFTHEHEFFEIFCIYNGSADVKIQGVRHQLHTGDLLIIPPGTTHSVGIFDDSTAFNIIVKASTFQSTFFPMIANDSALSQFFSHVLFQKTEGNYLIFHAGEDAMIRTTLQDLYIEYLGHGKYSTTFMNTILILLWAQLLRYHENDIESILTKSYSGAAITEILDYLTKHYQTVSLHEAADHFGFSASHFSTLIKEGTGRTFVQIIKEIKLTQACRALTETPLSIASICELVGYENPEHFMRTFKKVYGMTPGQYRKEHRK